MSDSENERKPDSQEGPSVMTPETLKESLDELAKNVDDLVDRLTMDMTDSPVDENRSKQPAVPPSAPAMETPPSKTPPESPVPDEPPPAATFAPDEPAEAPETTPTADDADLVAAGSIDEDLEIMGLAGDVIDSVADTEADSAEADALPAESVEPEATAEISDAAPMTLADRIDAELAKTADPTVDSATEVEADDFMGMATPVEPEEFEDMDASLEEEMAAAAELEPPALEDTAAGPEEEVASPVEPEAPALEAQDADAVPEPPEPLDLDVQKEIDAIDAGLDSLLMEDEVETGAETEEPETLKLADGAAPEIELAAGPAPAGKPDQAPAAGPTSRLKKPARADVIPWSSTSSSRPRSRGMSRTWRLVAAMLFLGAICGGAWVMLSTDEPPTIDFQLAASGGANRDSGDATSRTAGSAIPFIPASSGDGALQGDSPRPEETAAAQPETPPAPEAPAAAPAPKQRPPSPPRAETPKPVVAKKPAAAPAKQPSGKTATKPTPKPQPVKQETKPAKPQPKTAVKTAPPVAPKVADARPVAVPVTAPKPPPPEQPVAAAPSRPEPATPDETPTGKPSTASTTAVASNVDRDPPTPVKQPEPAPPKPAPRPRAAAGPTGPSATAAELVAPQLVLRQEPIYPPRARKRGEGGVVELKVLVNEQGRVVRVVVEQGLPGSELEARAIDAALRSTYRPATEAGQPVRAWVTERFVFEP